MEGRVITFREHDMTTRVYQTIISFSRSLKHVTDVGMQEIRDPLTKINPKYF